MEVCRTIADCRTLVRRFRTAGESVGLVPTMGFLHEGHMSLVAAAKKAADRVVVTIFVNPTQFGEAADLESYPRDEARDLEMLEEAGVDVVLIPSVEEVYPGGDETIVETTRMANMLHGLVRPGHFRGVTTVVARLFNFVQPDIACFGEKDYQQLQVIKRMTRDLAFPIDIRGVPTVREPDGLAMSSRNVRLTPEDRAAALVLSQSLTAAEQAAAKGTTIEALRDLISSTVSAEPRATLCGLDIVGAEDLSDLSGDLTSPAAIMISVEFGGILLIDQRVVTP
ncbi:pantoate--beta-alanine ligase [Shimia thalassica]|uniref:pantoate--beta-alanine ligase n=1 Tax=Shimia thalassica TaxID=1715693 RepID=UPI001C088D9E|nr:pantoate--beta-alanine ligase [Shimia thalassica]MBU2942823.1 pantoate--beta-alanine ligase [Shimia thalassica]MDO6502409.1 pantoate--beta-alanine ligase [Shimia thalassica]